MKIAIAVLAYGGTVRAETLLSIVQDVSWVYREEHDLAMFAPDMHGIDRARNRSVQMAREAEADLLLMVDSDTACDPSASALELLVGAMRKQKAHAVSGVVPMKPPRMAPNVHPVKPCDVYEAEKVGAAYLLLDMHKLEELSPGHVWFSWRIGSDGITVEESEDLFFSREIRGKGGKLIADFRLPTVHMVTVPLEMSKLLAKVAAEAKIVH